MPNLGRLLKYVPATSSALISHENISKNTYFQITKKNGSEISLHVHFNPEGFFCSFIPHDCEIAIPNSVNINKTKT